MKDRHELKGKYASVCVYIDVKYGNSDNPPMNTLLDNGSELNLMTTTVARKLKLFVDVNTDWVMIPANYERQQLVGVVHDCLIEIGGVKRYSPIWIREGDTEDIILGRPAQRQFAMTFQDQVDGTTWIYFNANTDGSGKRIGAQVLDGNEERNREDVGKQPPFNNRLKLSKISIARDTEINNMFDKFSQVATISEINKDIESDIGGHTERETTFKCISSRYCWLQDACNTVARKFAHTFRLLFRFCEHNFNDIVRDITQQLEIKKKAFVDEDANSLHIHLLKPLHTSSAVSRFGGDCGGVGHTYGIEKDLGKELGEWDFLSYI